MSFKQLFTVLCIILIAGSISAEIPFSMNYQGSLSDATGAPVADGVYTITFSIYPDDTTAGSYWSSGPETINIMNGQFSYILGSNIASEIDLISVIDFQIDTSMYLGIKVGSDPELSPRTRFLSVPYSYISHFSHNATTSSTSGNSQYLNSELPTYYLDWNNLTNVPSGFADGTDEGGLSQSTADSNYVNTNGDVMTGNLNFESSGDLRLHIFKHEATIQAFYEGVQRYSLKGWNWGELFLFDASGDTAVALGTEHNLNGYLSLNALNGEDNILLNSGNTGNASVILPDDAIDNTEIIDETGISQGSKTTGTTIPSSGTTMSDVITTTITTPAPGYIFLTAKCYVSHFGVTSANITSVQIDEESGGDVESPHYNYVGNSEYASTNVYRFSTALSRTYYKSTAGTYTFRLEAIKTIATGSTTIYQPIITAIYIPTSYGTVTTVANNPSGDQDAKMVSITDEDGNTHTGYEIDLRNLELEVKTAQLKAKEAELELMKARQLHQSGGRDNK